jgi:hypothetical protein
MGGLTGSARRPIQLSAGATTTSVLVGAAFAFGLLAAAVEGHGVGRFAELRNAIGNLSAPWLLVVFVAGIRGSRLWSGALVALLATMIALVGFYLLNAVAQDLGEEGFIGDLRLELSANRGYLQGGAISGPILGAIGAWWRRSRRLHALTIVGALLMAEPLVLLVIGALGPDGVLPAGEGIPTVVRIVPGWDLTGDRGGIAAAVYAAEFLIGLGLLLLAVLRPHSLDQSPLRVRK